MVHEISHFYQVGDEYAGGQLIGGKHSAIWNEGYGYASSGYCSKRVKSIYSWWKNDESRECTTTSSQIPYDSVEHKLIRHDMTSYMGKDGYAMQEYWTTGMIWKHLIQEWRITE